MNSKTRIGSLSTARLQDSRCSGVLLSALLLAVPFFTSCGGAAAVNPPPPLPPPPSGMSGTISMYVLPGVVDLGVGQTQTFTAYVHGTTNTAVTWTLQEGAAAGSITVVGVYTAPQSFGIFHVIATSQADTRISTMAMVSVVPIAVNGYSTNVQARQAPVSRRDREESRVDIAAVYGKLPLSFEANEGQADAQVKFVSRGSGYTLYLTATEAVLNLQRDLKLAEPEGSQVVSEHKGLRETRHAKPKEEMTGSPDPLRMKLIGSNPAPDINGLEPLPGRGNYFIGNDPAKWHTAIPTYAKVKYKDLYPGVDLVYYGNQHQLEYDFIVAPGVNPRVIRLAITGAKNLGTNANGDLDLHTAEGKIRLQKPVVYQQMGSLRNEIAGRYVLRNKREIGFEVASYDAAKPLIIDPVLSYSTYLGGNSYDEARSIAVDDSGNAYVTGHTASLNFPTKNPLQPALGSGNYIGAFVTKLDPTGASLIYSTYLGGSGPAAGFAIAVDRAGSAYVTGFTDSADFPTKNPFQSARSSLRDDAFVTKLDPTGSALVYSTYLGGSGSDFASAIAVDASGNAYVTGSTDSSDFPTKNPFQTALGGSSDAFVTKFDSTGSALMYSTYLGGSSDDFGSAIAVDSLGNAYVTGATGSANFPTASAFQGVGAGSKDAFVTKLNPTGNTLLYSTYLGGTAFDQGRGIAVDAAGNAYVTGITQSTDFPTTPGAFQTNFQVGFNNAFVTKLNPVGAALLYSTYLSGTGYDGASGIATDSSGSAYVGSSAFVDKLNSMGSALLYSAKFIDSNVNGIAVDSLGNVYVTGSTTYRFLVTPGAFQTSPGGNGYADAFVAKISPDDAAGFSLSGFSLNFPDEGIGVTAAPQQIILANSGSAILTIASIVASGDFAETNNCTSTMAGGTSCTINVTFSPTADGARTGTVAITDSVASSPQTVSLTGNGLAGLSATLSPTSLGFENQALGTTSAPRFVTLNNSGRATLTINAYSLEGANPCDFGYTNEWGDCGFVGTTCSRTLAVGASCTFDMVFAPSAVGNRSATLQIVDNSAQSPRSVPLTGIGIPAPPDFSISAASSTFATVTAGQSATYSVSTVGTGGFSGTVSVTCTDPVPQSMCNVSPESLTVGATPVSSTVTVTTTARSTVLVRWRPPTVSLWTRVALPVLLLMLGLAMLAEALQQQFRAGRRVWTGLAVVLFSAALFIGCGGGSGATIGSNQPPPHGTPTGSYIITVNAVSAGITRTTQLTLAVR